MDLLQPNRKSWYVQELGTATFFWWRLIQQYLCNGSIMMEQLGQQHQYSTARNEWKGTGTNSSFYYAGYPQVIHHNTTEEFTGETTALNVKTLTQS